MHILTDTIVARRGGGVNLRARNRAPEESSASEWGAYVQYASAAQRHEKTPQSARLDLWNALAGSPNVEGSLVTVGEFHALIELIEPAMTFAEQRGAGLGADALWYPASWVWATTDRDLARVFMHLATLKDRLKTLISVGNRAVINDHVWVAMLFADIDDEVLRRLRRRGNKTIGDGSATDALRNHISRRRARMNWIATNLRGDNTGSAVPTW